MVMNMNYNELKKELNDTMLVIVSKKRTIEQIKYYYDLGHRHFGENKAQELLTKVNIANDIKWHFIGHLQTNKVKMILPYIYSIDSVDSIHLLKEIDKQAKILNKNINILIQLNIAKEDTKHGLLEEEIADFMKQTKDYPNVCVKGFMCMGPHVEDEEKILEVFNKAHQIFLDYQQEYHLDTLSMGMSDDYKLALKASSTHVRLGSIMF